MKHRTVFLLTVMLLLAGSCLPEGQRGNGDDNYFSDFETIPSYGWLYSDTLTFSADTLRDSVATGRIALCLRHSGTYRYSNIWLELSYRPDDSTVVRDTVDMPLADSYGNWLGTGMGASFQRTDTLDFEPVLRMRQPLYLRHIMRLDTLRGIERAGIVFIPSQP